MNTARLENHHETGPSLRIAERPTVSTTLVEALERLGICHAFGVSGGAIGAIWHALTHSTIPVLHFRHETGAAFAAIEAYFASGRPAAVFTTTGPGFTNVLTGLFAAHDDGAKLLLLSPHTAAPQRGRWAFQETSSFTLPAPGLFAPGVPCHYATILESPASLPQVVQRLAVGFARPGAFVAHVSIPIDVQGAPWTGAPLRAELPKPSMPAPSPDILDECVRRLSEGTFAIWAGFGARRAASALRHFAERTGAAVMCSPRAKGVLPEDHPQYLGVTGFAGHRSVLEYMARARPRHILVLGTRLGEFTSFWNPAMVPPGGFVHVDLDPDVPGAAYPSVATLGVQSDIGVFLEALRARLPARPPQVITRPESLDPGPPRAGRVRPVVLMEAIQRRAVEGSDAIVLAEGGNSYAWAINTLRFQHAARYRVSLSFAAMGHASTGVLGAALQHGRALAIVGDGAMLMINEVNTAVAHAIPAAWVVLNDGRYNMCAQGMPRIGFAGVDTDFPRADFVAAARAYGADGVRVQHESGLDAALEAALSAKGPFVVDVLIDPEPIAPCGARFQSLVEQGADGAGALVAQSRGQFGDVAHSK